MVSEFKGATGAGEIATRGRAHLPGLDIEIVHRRSPEGDAEEISINLKAVPSFEAFGRFLEQANPFAFWAQAARLAWFPWLAAAHAVMLPLGSAAPSPRAGSETALHSSERPSPRGVAERPAPRFARTIHAQRFTACSSRAALRGVGDHVERILSSVGKSADIIARAKGAEASACCRRRPTTRASSAFLGAPTLRDRAEIFWGDDRPEEVVAFAAKEQVKAPQRGRRGDPKLQKAPAP
jgi:hypothetical protein